MHRWTYIFLALLAVLALNMPALGGFWDEVNTAVDTLRRTTGTEPDEGSGGLSTKELSEGLQETLRLGTERAVALASSPGGFFKNPDIRIPLPAPLQKGSNLLRKFGLEGPVVAFEETMNQAAERAAAEALPIFGKALEELTFEDVKRLWKGGENAATDYLRTTTWDSLYERFRPAVHTAGQEVGVTQAYQNLTNQPALQGLVAGSDLDLDYYVTERTLNGLFALLANEEKKIRTDPAARTTDLLRKVFGN